MLRKFIADTQQRIRGGGRRQPLVQLVRPPRMRPSPGDTRAVDFSVGVRGPLRATRVQAHVAHRRVKSFVPVEQKT